MLFLGSIEPRDDAMLMKNCEKGVTQEYWLEMFNE